jgi:hypothetical protein
MSPPIPPATVAIPPTTRPDPPPLDWDGPHRRLDRVAQEMMGGEAVDVALLDPIGRLGYDQYVRVREAFRMTRPRWPDDAA